MTPRSPASRRVRGALAGLVLAAAAGGVVGAHVRLIHPSNGSPLFWQNPGNVGIVVQSDGSSDLPDGSHFTALRNAIDAWNSVPGASAELVENTNPAQQARTDWQSSDIHLVMFDEQNDSGFFPFGSGIVAITPLWFLANGRITDADILFNGGGFQFTTSQAPGRFDVQDVGAHELGHLLGLDHSGWAGATMFPYVDSTVILHRSLALDDAVGLRSAYPAAAFATITGRVERDDGSGVAGAHVVALGPSGRTRAGILANAQGQFTLTGLDGGSYTIHASPLDGPVVAANLSGGQTVHIDFQPTWYPTAVTVAPGGTTAAGTLVVAPDAVINLGRPSDRLPLRATSGTSTLHSLRGSALVAGSTLTPSDPSVGVLPQSWLGSAVVFRVAVAADAEPGHVDLVVENIAGERAVLAAALEICPPDPIVDDVTPATVGGGGGTLMTVTGSRFRPGLRVVVGPRIYVDGEPGGCTVLDDSTIQFQLQTTPPGIHDVVVIDATGVEGREADALLVTELPTVASIFPSAGTAAGGTLVTITGDDFAPEAIVRIDGVVQTTVAWDGPSSLRVVTQPGLIGGPYALEVENPGGHVAQGVFAYVAPPDPVVTAIEPGIGPSGGGSAITLQGAGFDGDVEVVFGANPATGAGGAVAPTVVLVDGGTLAVVTPPGASGPAAVVVRRPTTGQASVAPGAFVYQGSGGGGGGGCSTRRSIAPGNGIDGGALGMLCLVAVALVLAWRARRELTPRTA